MQSNATINLNFKAHLEAAIDRCNTARQMLCLNVLQRGFDGGGLVSQFENFTTVLISQKDTLSEDERKSHSTQKSSIFHYIAR